jgi:hypothetical protein
MKLALIHCFDLPSLRFVTEKLSDRIVAENNERLKAEVALSRLLGW